MVYGKYLNDVGTEWGDTNLIKPKMAKQPKKRCWKISEQVFLGLDQNSIPFWGTNGYWNQVSDSTNIQK